MKWLAMTVVAVLVTGSIGAQTDGGKKENTTAANAGTQKALVEMETTLWEGWKNHDVSPFKKVILAEAVDVTAEGIIGTDEMLKTISSTECTVNSYSIESSKVTWLNKTTALLTYKGNQDAICGGQKVPAAVWASSIWVNQKGEWKNVFHQETPASTATPAAEKKAE